MSDLFTLHQLRVFLTVYEEGNIRDAAERLHRTPSAISMTLKQFEERFGTSLFQTERKNQLTDVGIQIAQDVRKFLDHAGAMERNVISYAQGLSGHLNVACVPSISVAFLSETLGRFWERHPNVRINIQDADSRTVQEMVLTGIVEIGVAAPIGQFAPPNFVPLFQDRLCLVCAADDPLCALDRPVEWEMLRDRTFLSNNTHRQIRTPGFLEIEARKKADMPNIISLLSLVRAGTGVTVLPKLSSLHGTAGVRFLPLADESASRVVGLLTRQGQNRSPAARGFTDILSEVVVEHATEYGLSLGV